MKITKVSVSSKAIKLKSPLIISLGKIEYAMSAVVKIETDEGIVGIGEGAPGILITGETLEGTAECIREIGKVIIGCNPLDFEKIYFLMNSVAAHAPSAKTAIDIAIHDIIGKVTNQSIAQLFGGYRESIETDMTLSIDEAGVMEWIDGNIGSKVTMKYPCCVLKGDNSRGTCITISVAKSGQEQDSGARMIHIGKNTKSNIVSKSIAGNGGNATYRGKVEIKKNALNSDAMVKCDSLILDDKSMSDTIPTNIVGNITSNIEHEATVSKISDDVLFYLMSRGIPEERATELIVLGFIDEFKSELPMEYAVELNQLIKRNL